MYRDVEDIFSKKTWTTVICNYLEQSTQTVNLSNSQMNSTCTKLCKIIGMKQGRARHVKWSGDPVAGAL